MYRFPLLSILLLVNLSAWAQAVVPLWGKEEAPFAKPHELQEYEADCWGVVCAHQVVDPTLTLYLPEIRETPAGRGLVAVVLPGGAYEKVAIYHEGHEVAAALAARGITAAVLKYRLPNPETSTRPEWVPLADLRQALRLLRTRQSELGFTASRFGVVGFSAGSHLATVAAVHRAADSAQNPDFSILVYGVTLLNAENRDWLEQSLYHRKMSEQEVVYQTLLDHVDADTPPAFLVHSLDDDECHYSESTRYAEALRRRGVAAEMHLFARGGHGFGLGRESDGTAQWLDLAVNWLYRLGREQAN
jgi:acetyl esterase/lipase